MALTSEISIHDTARNCADCYEPLRGSPLWLTLAESAIVRGEVDRER